jgi:hypothetical protein
MLVDNVIEGEEPYTTGTANEVLERLDLKLSC